MSRSSPQMNTQLWSDPKSATRFARKHRHVFYGHKVMDELKILARLARPSQSGAYLAMPMQKTASRRLAARAR